MFKWWAGVNFLLLFISFSCGRRLGIFFKFFMIVFYFYWLLFELWAGVSFLFIFISFSCGRRLGILFVFLKSWLYSIVIVYCLNCGLMSISSFFLFPFPVEDDYVFCSILWKDDCTLLLLTIFFELWAGVNFLFIFISFSCGRWLGILF